jgi:hypothetical protein
MEETKFKVGDRVRILADDDKQEYADRRELQGNSQPSNTMRLPFTS